MVREAEGRDVARMQFRVALLVALERCPGSVVAPAVELDGEVVLRPVGVDFVAVELLVGERARQAVAVAEVDERGFEVAAGELWCVLRQVSDVLRARPLFPGACSHGHVDPPGRRRAQVPERRGLGVAQNGARPKRAHRRKPRACLGDAAVPHGVNPAVERNQPPTGDPPPDLRPRRADRPQPGDVDDPMIEVGQRRYPLIKRSLVEISVHATLKSTGVEDSPPTRVS